MTDLTHLKPEPGLDNDQVREFLRLRALLAADPASAELTAADAVLLACVVQWNDGPDAELAMRVWCGLYGR